jgi:soluble lytic murein transglycosylase-like protein
MPRRLARAFATTWPLRAHRCVGPAPDLPVTRCSGEGFHKNGVELMLGIPHYLTCAAGAAALVAQTALAQANFAHAHDRHHAASAYRHRLAHATPQQDTANAPFYGPSGGYADAYGASRYAGPKARHYFGSTSDRHAEFDGMVEQQASANGVPASLVHRVIMRESGYHPRAVSAGNYGLMQIRLGTARAMGYGGSAAGLLDAGTNMTYAVRYLAGAYRAAGGNEARAVALYARGY